MKSKITALAVAGAAFAALPAFAQTAAPAAATAAATPLRHGPPVPGLCIFSRDTVIATSQVGKFVVERVKQLDAPSEAELTGMRDALEKDVQTFQTGRATMTADAVNQRGTELSQRNAQMQQLYQVRARESQVTAAKALDRVDAEMSPLVTQAYQAHNCSVLLEAGAILAASPQSDLTPEVVRLLDAKITQFNFDRERLDTGQAGAGATAPAAPAAAPAAPAARSRR